jgi:hypothetical protein
MRTLLNRRAKDWKLNTTLPVARARRWRTIQTGVELRFLRNGTAVSLNAQLYSRDDATDVVAAMRKLGAGSKGALPVYVTVGRSEDARRVYELLAKLPAKVSLRLVVSKDGTGKKRPRPKAPAAAAPWFGRWLAKHYRLTDQLMAATTTEKKRAARSERAQAYGAAVARTIGSCEPLKRVYKDLAAGAFAQHAQMKAARIPKAMAACKCAGVDVGYEFIEREFERPYRPYGWLPLPKKLPSVGPDATVADLATFLAKREAKP